MNLNFLPKTASFFFLDSIENLLKQLSLLAFLSVHLLTLPLSLACSLTYFSAGTASAVVTGANSILHIKLTIEPYTGMEVSVQPVPTVVQSQRNAQSLTNGFKLLLIVYKAFYNFLLSVSLPFLDFSDIAVFQFSLEFQVHSFHGITKLKTEFSVSHNPSHNPTSLFTGGLEHSRRLEFDSFVIASKRLP